MFISNDFGLEVVINTVRFPYHSYIFHYTAVVGRGKLGACKLVNHATFLIETDRPWFVFHNCIVEILVISLRSFSVLLCLL